MTVERDSARSRLAWIAIGALVVLAIGAAWQWGEDRASNYWQAQRQGPGELALAGVRAETNDSNIWISSPTEYDESWKYIEENAEEFFGRSLRGMPPVIPDVRNCVLVSDAVSRAVDFNGRPALFFGFVDTYQVFGSRSDGDVQEYVVQLIGPLTDHIRAYARFIWSKDLSLEQGAPVWVDGLVVAAGNVGMTDGIPGQAVYIMGSGVAALPPDGWFDQLPGDARPSDIVCGLGP